jgi:hypothetical protein
LVFIFCFLYALSVACKLSNSYTYSSIEEGTVRELEAYQAGEGWDWREHDSLAPHAERKLELKKPNAPLGGTTDVLYVILANNE